MKYQDFHIRIFFRQKTKKILTFMSNYRNIGKTRYDLFSFLGIAEEKGYKSKFS
jgi:hypothetical protein